MKYYIDGCEIKSVTRVPMRSDGSYVVRFPHDAVLSQLEAINWDKPTIDLFAGGLRVCAGSSDLLLAPPGMDGGNQNGRAVSR